MGQNKIGAFNRVLVTPLRRLHGPPGDSRSSQWNARVKSSIRLAQDRITNAPTGYA